MSTGESPQENQAVATLHPQAQAMQQVAGPSMDSILLQSSQPQPPAAEASVQGISFDQAVRGISQKFRQLETVQALFKKVSVCLEDKELPIISIPTGDTDTHGDQIIADVDLAHILRGVRDPDQRRQILHAMLGPINNYCCAEYRRCLEELSQYTSTAVQLLHQHQAGQAGGPRQ